MSTDKRGTKYLDQEKYKYNIIDTPKLGNNPIKLIITIFKLFLITIKSYYLLKEEGIKIVISTGGYMSLPICVAAKFMKINIYLFEPNIVLGKANNFFLKYCRNIFCYTDKMINYPKKLLNKIILIDPLIRKEFYLIKKRDNKSKELFNILIIGGSQGAQLFDLKLRKSIIHLSKNYKLKIFQQVNTKYHNELENFYNINNINHKLFDFEEEIVEYMSNSDLAITRAGASTLSELTFSSVPFLAIPLPSAKDNHQYYNALFYKKLGCCWLLEESKLTEETLTAEIINIINNRDGYLLKKKNMKKISYQNIWNNINHKITNTINENKNS